MSSSPGVLRSLSSAVSLSAGIERAACNSASITTSMLMQSIYAPSQSGLAIACYSSLECGMGQ